jgi:hypothetical protein
MIMLDVIGAGFGRTGTLSLKLALERLGFGPCHHMLELIDDPVQLALWSRVGQEPESVDWDAVFRGYRATADWPGVRFWRQITDHFAGAKVILTTRDPRQWYESAHASIYRAVTAPVTGDPLAARRREIVARLVWDGEFGGRFGDAAYAIRVFNEHNEAVRRRIAADRLLVFEVTQGWEPLCAFLGVPVPDEPFPRSNDRREFAERVARRGGGRAPGR